MQLLKCNTCVVFAVLLHISLSNAQTPPRLQIPGAVLLSQAKPVPFRQQPRLSQQPDPRIRRPSQPPQPIRPVVEEEFENEQPQNSNTQFFDDEVAKLGLAAFQSALRQNIPQEEEEQNNEPPKPVQFRPERPVPVLRQDIRENVPRPAPVLRQELSRPAPPPQQSRPRQEIREEIVSRPQPARQAQQQVRAQIPVQQPPQAFRQRVQAPVRQQAPQYLEDDDQQQRKRKPPVQILRKYRTDNEDGSITWGYENEDGTFKEETLGIDCVTRGKYGYVDPDGVRREYSYETGNKCDEPEEEELAQLPPQGKQFVNAPPPRKQFRPQQLPDN